MDLQGSETENVITYRKITFGTIRIRRLDILGNFLSKKFTKNNINNISDRK